MRPRRKATIRFTALALLSALLGIFTAWAASWAIAAWDQRKGGAFENAAKPEMWNWVNEPRSRDPVSAFVGLFAGAPSGKREQGKPGTRLVTFSPGYDELRVWWFGLPWPCASFSEKTELTTAFGPSGPVTATTNRTENHAWRFNAAGKLWLFPMRLDWPALAKDAAFWSAAFATFLVGIPLTRRLWRSQSGLCIDCGYDCRALPPGSSCPECGSHRSSPDAP